MIEFAPILTKETLKNLMEHAKRQCRVICNKDGTIFRVYSRKPDVVYGALDVFERLVRGGSQNTLVVADPYVENHPLLDHPTKPLAVVEWKGGLGFVYATTKQLVKEKPRAGSPSFLLMFFPPEGGVRIHYLSLAEEIGNLEESSVHFRAERSRPGRGFKVSVNVSGKKVKKMKDVRREMEAINDYVNRTLGLTNISRLEVHGHPVSGTRANFGVSIHFKEVPSEDELGAVLEVVQKVKDVLASRVNLSLWALREKGFKEE